MKLYEVPRNTWVMPIDNAKAPPGAREIIPPEAVKFHHIDGMFSYCTDIWGKTVHMAAWTEVEIVEAP